MPFKNHATINFTKATLTYILKDAEVLGLKISPYIESIVMIHAFKCGYKPDANETENLRNSFLVNGPSNMTYAFRNQIATFSQNAQRAILDFFYHLNLVENYRISTQKMANIFKHEELCYFALGKIGHSQKYVNDYLRTYHLCIKTIGISSAADEEYLFFSNYQQFKVKKPYPLFSSLLNELKLPSDTEVIRVHFSQLPTMADAISKI